MSTEPSVMNQKTLPAGLTTMQVEETRTTQFRPVSTIPLNGLRTKVLLKTSSSHVLVGVIFENGTPGIYDFCKDRYVQREDWHGITGWMPLPE